jgi:hypothetical protein
MLAETAMSHSVQVTPFQIQWHMLIEVPGSSVAAVPLQIALHVAEDKRRNACDYRA